MKKRVLALILVFSMLCGMIGTVSMAAEADTAQSPSGTMKYNEADLQENLLADGNFDNEVDSSFPGWITRPGAGISLTTVRDEKRGGYVAKLDDNSEALNQILRYDLNFQKTNKFVLSFWYKTINSIDSASGFHFIQNNTTMIKSFPLNSNEWKQVVVTIGPKDSGADVEIPDTSSVLITFHTGAPAKKGTLFLDDISLRKIYDPNEPNLNANISREKEDELTEKIYSAYDALGKGDYKLPTWFDETRTHLHTRIVPNLMKTPTDYNFSKDISQYGVKVVTRHADTGNEAPWWPSKAPLSLDGKTLFDGERSIGNKKLKAGENMFKPAIDEATKYGQNIIAYTWIGADSASEKLHPEWICKDLTGKPISHKRGNYLDITGPYREVALTRLLELAEMGAKGFYFDAEHFPVGGSWGGNFEKQFVEFMGIEAPKTNSFTDPAYRLFVLFRAYKVTETFNYWREKVNEKYPGTVFITSIQGLSGSGVSPHFSTNMLRLMDSAKTEVDFPTSTHSTELTFNAYNDPKVAIPSDEDRVAFIFSMLRDAANGRAPHSWTQHFPNVENGIASMSAMLTFGVIANIDYLENMVPQDFNKPFEGNDLENRKIFKELYAFGAKLNPHLGNTEPNKFFAVHFNERSRDKRLDKPSKAYKEVLLPSIGAFNTALRLGVPAGVVTDYQIENEMLDGYKVIFISNPDELTAKQLNSLGKFKANGGVVINNNSSYGWGEIGNNENSKKLFAKELESYLSLAPTRVSINNPQVKSGSYVSKDGSRIAIPITNEFSWFEESWEGYIQNHPLHDIKNISGIKVFVKSDKMPLDVIEAVSGQKLEATKVAGGFEIAVPTFGQFALISVNYGGSAMFNDIGTHWAKADIQEMASAGLIKGKGEGKFDPESSITRAEFLALATRAAGLGVLPYQGMFTDVKADAWYSGVVQAAYDNKIIDENMIANKAFNPTAPITREEMTSIIINTYKLKKQIEIKDIDATKFSDTASISKWALKYVDKATELGIIKGMTETTFAPSQTATRAQSAVILKRLLMQIK